MSENEYAGRGFRGIWIPASIWLALNLTLTEKVLLAEIDSLDTNEGCFASNAYFARFLGVTETTVSTSISKLKSLGLIYQHDFNGRKRILKSNIAKGFDQLVVDKVATQPELFQTEMERKASAKPVGDFIDTKKGKLTGRRLEAFKELWEAFKFKNGKTSAAGAWMELCNKTEVTKPIYLQILKCCKLEALRRDDKKDGETPKWFQGWITERRWEDEVYKELEIKYAQYLK